MVTIGTEPRIYLFGGGESAPLPDLADTGVELPHEAEATATLYRNDGAATVGDRALRGPHFRALLKPTLPASNVDRKVTIQSPPEHTDAVRVHVRAARTRSAPTHGGSPRRSSRRRPSALRP